MDQYIRKLRDYLEPSSNPSDAIPMKKYMKNRFEYLGIRSPLRNALLSEFIKENGLPDKHTISAVVRSLWELPEREYQYCAMTIAGKVVKRLTVDFLTTIEYMISTKSWWDTVDFIAANLAGPYFKSFPEQLLPTTEKWSQSDNMWFNRSAIIFQLRYKTQTDTDLLTAYILPHIKSKEFFIQKAIGWALREYSKTDASWVKTFISNHELKPLSRKEAFKWLNRK